MARELVHTCLQHAPASGNLTTGGLGPWAYLQLELSRQPLYKKDRLVYLLAARDACLEALQTCQPQQESVSLLTNEWVGAKCVLAAVYYQLGDANADTDADVDAQYTIASQQQARDVVEWLTQACACLAADECDVLYGRAGALQAIYFLRQELKEETIGHEFVLETVKAMILQGLKTSNSQQQQQQQQQLSDATKTNNGSKKQLATTTICPSMLLWRFRGTPFLGTAHGVVGILHTLLGLTREEWTWLDNELPRVKEVVQQAIDSLEDMRHYPSGNLRITWEGCVGEYAAAAAAAAQGVPAESWAHGCPGYCLLLLQAYQVFGNGKYVELAASMADQVIWSHRNHPPQQQKGLGLGNGLTGNGYVFLALSQVDIANSALWKLRAWGDWPVCCWI
jgi:hypothetical protein